MAKPSVGATLDTGHSLAPDTLCYLFNEGSGSTANDLTANNNDATLVGPTWGANGLDFGTAGDAATFTEVSCVNTPWTLAFSAKQDASGSLGMILGKPGHEGNFVWFQGGTRLRVASGNYVNCDFSGVTDFTATAIYHLVVDDAYVNGVTDGSVKLYKNGTLIASIAIGERSNYAFSAVGDGYADNSRSMVGEIDWLMLDKRAWSGAEVTSHAADPFQMFSGGGGAARRASACVVA